MIKFFVADKNKSSSNEKLKFHILAERQNWFSIEMEQSEMTEDNSLF